MNGERSRRLHSKMLTGGSMRRFCSALALAALLVPVLIAQQKSTEDGIGISHVLLISVDGLHALDVSRYVETHPHSALAELSRHGVTYTNARTPANSDSFPGLLALV